MYTKVYHSLKELNLYSKLIGLILIMLSIMMVKNVYLVFSIIGISIIISALLRHFEALQLSIILIVISMFYYLHPFLLIIVKLIMLYVFYLIGKEMMNHKEKMYLMDKLFYKSKNKQSIDMYLNTCYKNRCFSDNLKVYDDIDKYTRRKYSKYIIKQSEIKTSYDIQDIFYRSKLSYYKFYNKKTTILNMKWNSVDNSFLIISFLIFILVCIYR